MTTKRWYIVGGVVVAVVAVLWFMKRRGALAANVVSAPAVGVRASIGSNLFSVHDRSPGNIMSNLFTPSTSPVSAGPTPVVTPFVSQVQRQVRSIIG